MTIKRVQGFIKYYFFQKIGKRWFCTVHLPLDRHHLFRGVAIHAEVYPVETSFEISHQKQICEDCWPLCRSIGRLSYCHDRARAPKRLALFQQKYVLVQQSVSLSFTTKAILHFWILTHMKPAIPLPFSLLSMIDLYQRQWFTNRERFSIPLLCVEF